MTICLEIKEGRAAKYWGLLPWEFDELSALQKGRLLALYEVEQAIEGYYESEKARLVNKNNPN